MVCLLSLRVALTYRHFGRYNVPPVLGSNHLCHFEVILVGDGSVILQYLDMPDDSSSWSDENSIGFEDQTGTKGVQIGYGVVPAPGTAYQIPPACHVEDSVGGGGHRRQLLVDMVAERLQQRVGVARRRAQSAGCDLADMQNNIDHINLVCCDEACTGVPTTCDAKCGVYFVDFYDRCQAYLAPMLGASAAFLMNELYSTCSEDLPTAELLAMVANCSTAPSTNTSILLDTVGGNCDITLLERRTGMLNAACWPAGIATDCTLPCATELFPLLEDCRGILNAIYDSIDGTDDGNAAVLSTQHDSCLTIPAVDVLRRVEELHDTGRCPNEALDGVAEVDVNVDTTCEDTNPSCQMILATGLSCNSLRGACDASCGLCGSPGKGRRRTQRAVCNLASVQEDIDRINCLCCDTPSSCQQGVPSTCDAKCAVFFVDFFNRCESYINLQIDTTTAAGLSLLAATCTEELPVEPLIRVMAECTAGWVPRGRTERPELEPHSYQDEIPGWCSGPAGIGAINGKSKYGVATQADCEAACDAEATCIGYAYAATVDGQQGCCSVYGPGIVAAGEWVGHTDSRYPLLFHGDGDDGYGGTSEGWPKSEGIPKTGLYGSVFLLIVPYNSNSLITAVDDGVVHSNFDGASNHNFITDGVCVTRFGLAPPPPPCEEYRTMCSDGICSGTNRDTGYCNGPGGADDTVEARRIFGWNGYQGQIEARCAQACTADPACMGWDVGADTASPINDAIMLTFCRNFGPGMGGYTLHDAEAEQVIPGQRMVLDHQMGTNEDADHRQTNADQRTDQCMLLQNYPFSGCHWESGWAATQGIVAGTHPLPNDSEGTASEVCLGNANIDCAVCKVKHCPCEGVMCLNGGECTIEDGHHVCICAFGFSGQWCEVHARRQLQGTTNATNWCH